MYCTRYCKYGGEEEYYVEVRETGNIQQKRSSKEKTTEQQKDRYTVDWNQWCERFVESEPCGFFQPHPINTSLVLDDGKTSCFQDDSTAEMPTVEVGKVDGDITRNKILAGTAVTAYTEATLGWLSWSSCMMMTWCTFCCQQFVGPTSLNSLNWSSSHMWVLQKSEVSCSTLSTFPTMFLYDLCRVVVLIPIKDLPRLVTAPPWLWIANCQASKSKTVFTKYVESVLARCAKIRTLISDLQRNYDDPLAVQFLDKTFKWYCVPKQTKKEIGS